MTTPNPYFKPDWEQLYETSYRNLVETQERLETLQALDECDPDELAATVAELETHAEMMVNIDQNYRHQTVQDIALCINKNVRINGNVPFNRNEIIGFTSPDKIFNLLAERQDRAEGIWSYSRQRQRELALA